jgi:Tol biopolymer transport system component
MEDRLGWVDRTGHFEPLPMASALSFGHPRISPDGMRLAYVAAGSETDIWVRDLIAGTVTRLTSEGVNLWPVWTRDGQRLAYASSRGRGASIFWRKADASEPEEVLLASEAIVGPRSWSTDDRTLLFVTTSGTTSGEIWSLSLSGRKTVPVLRSKFVTQEPSISPNGRWMAYMSNESGRSEVYVRGVVEPTARWQVSVDGGEEPVWGHTGRELFFRRGSEMVAVDVHGTATFAHGPARILFSGPFKRDGVNSNYDLDLNDQRFVMVKSAAAPDSAVRTTVTLNWSPRLNR